MIGRRVTERPGELTAPPSPQSRGPRAGRRRPRGRIAQTHSRPLQPRSQRASQSTHGPTDKSDGAVWQSGHGQPAAHPSIRRFVCPIQERRHKLGCGHMGDAARRIELIEQVPETRGADDMLQCHSRWLCETVRAHLRPGGQPGKRDRARHGLRGHPRTTGCVPRGECPQGRFRPARTTRGGGEMTHGVHSGADRAVTPSWSARGRWFGDSIALAGKVGA